MEKLEAAKALEDELIHLLDLTDRIGCMLGDVTENFLVFHDRCADKKEYDCACIRIGVAREAVAKISNALNGLLTR